MAAHLKPLTRLQGDQLRASGPRDHAALSASAGTGKTHVLTARLLRLMLSGVDPSTILCLTFTKAGAAEMADRVHKRLAHWVRLKDADLGAELVALGEEPSPANRDCARTLFASVLDAPGGGLRILTIHAFAQGLLAGFPAEAGLTPGFKPLEGREEDQLARQVLADLLVDAERGGEHGLIRDLQSLSHRLGEGGAEDFLRSCARAPDALEQIGPAPSIEARLRRAFDLPLGDVEEAISAQCCDDLFDIAGLRAIARMNLGWSAKAGQERAGICESWLSAAPADRAATLERLHLVWTKADGEIRSFGKGQAPQDEDYARLATAAFDCCARLVAMRRTAALVADLAAGLRIGQAFARRYGDAKRASGLVDFDDLIRSAERLLLQPGMGEWVRYKLDQATDHILVDEAQDTNERQWNIVRALAGEYFAGKGARGGPRTVFTVGDYKQAIFGFQGTDPQSFDVARAWFAREAGGAGQEFLDLSMDRSFRSAPPILEVVDGVMAALGPEAVGLPRPARPHESHHRTRPGSVTLWPPFRDEEPDAEAGEEDWVSDTVRRYAARIARQVRHWLDNPFHVEAKGRPLRPEDILILVRRRSTLAGLLVARLHAEGVPVAGIDRLLLSAPLAVQDLLAALRFAVQPNDDLNLAGLLVSPLIGWGQDRLFAVAHQRSGTLWEAVRASGDDAADSLASLLAMADFETPHGFLELILSGPLQGRRKLLQRLGHEARDPMEELVAIALDFEGRGAVTLQRFLDWFARGEVEVVRDPSAPLDAVRVMTVHGSKGLQAPVVILADATVDPERSRAGAVELQLEGSAVPLFRPKKAELVEPLKSQVEARSAADRQEHWRLLYVAMTRAEERLYVGGALGPADRNGPPDASWYTIVQQSLSGLVCQDHDCAIWTTYVQFGQAEMRVARSAQRVIPVPDLPIWAREAAPIEARPPRPLAPSSIGEDDVSNPPPSPAMRLAAERGRLLHQLFERLPAVPADERRDRAESWLERSAGVEDRAFRAALVDDACAIIGDPDFADIFSPDALAEAPIAAVIEDGRVVAGTVDRLLVGEERVRVVDFKTGRQVPVDVASVPPSHRRQMEAYAAALRVIFPGRAVEAALLYTAGPVLHRLELAPTGSA